MGDANGAAEKDGRYDSSWMRANRGRRGLFNDKLLKPQRKQNNEVPSP
ncbi:hypothetical protein PLANPX_3734 [Lacipirellula parvula]|uniref:Uncharacterized protein n=1 Tax=Lacipirellula parvula TaxID=2650471 RepID=A0A5K7XDP3_9BACT|nr:hypothetical protein PLANPX_3734 [Lacipirellula parvula]